VAAMDLQVQEIENEKLEKQKTDLQKQFESLSEKVVLLEKHEQKYNILIYGIDDSDQDENIYAVTRHLFTQDLEIDHRKENATKVFKLRSTLSSFSEKSPTF
jgi:predicted patatin/cPLA2 family phospholipase